MIKQTRYENYLVSSDGKIFSKNYRHTRKLRELKVSYNQKGYTQICLSLKGIYKTVKIHRLVAETFIPNPYKFEQVHHKNNIKDDNRVENLEWCNNSYNQKQAFLDGLQNNCGENHPSNKLTSNEVQTIRRLLKNGLSQYKIAKLFNVTQSNISSIKRNKTWSDLNEVHQGIYPQTQRKTETD